MIVLKGLVSLGGLGSLKGLRGLGGLVSLKGLIGLTGLVSLVRVMLIWLNPKFLIPNHKSQNINPKS